MNLKKFDEQIRHKVNQFFDDFIVDLSKIVEIKSISTPPVNGVPNDRICTKALLTMLDICKSYGFSIRNINDIVGYATWEGDSVSSDNEELFASLAHLDVVPASIDWITPNPFKLTKVGDKYIGRGILDDKGPAMCVLYAVKILKELNIVSHKPFRMIFGTNEECGSFEIPTLIKNATIPTLTFTPDSEYPLIFAEKGLVNYKINTFIDEDALRYFISIDGDMNRNRVPSDVTIKISDKTYKESGVQAHAAWPLEGVNALIRLSHIIANDNRLLYKNKDIKSLIEYFSWLDKCFRWNNHGSNIGLDDFDLSQDPLQDFIVTPYKLIKNNHHLSLYISVRYPAYISQDDITNKIFSTLSKLEYNSEFPHIGLALANSTYEIVRVAPPAYTDTNNKYVKKLLNAYRHVTKDFSDPVSSTGGSYAKHYPNTVAFGAAFQGRGHISGIAHNSNEFMYIDDIKKNIEIYAHAIYNLVMS